MELEQFKKVAEEIKSFLDEHDIENTIEEVDIEKEWTDFRAHINDLEQMERINTWLQNDLKSAIKDWTDIQISAPTPVAGKEHELRVRIYG